MNMPSLKHLLDDLLKLGAKPDDVRLSGTLYDDMVEQAEDSDKED
jgi:hypothetical protein